MNTPISVIIPTFNREKTILRAVQSVLNQTFDNFLLVVVDDGSKDNTAALLASIKDSRLKYVHQENQGRSIARNRGVDASDTPNIVFLDSDDEAMPNWLEHLVAVLKDPDVGIVCCGYVDADSSGKTSVVVPHYRGPMYGSTAVLFRPPGTFAMRREIFNEVGGYSESLSFSENTELAMRMVPCCERMGLKISSIAEPLIYYHKAPDRKAKSTQQFQSLLESSRFIISKHGSSLRSKFPRGYANYCAIAGVNALRLGETSEARKFLRTALTYDPLKMKNYVRFFLSLFPFVGRRFWLRFDQNA